MWIMEFCSQGRVMVGPLSESLEDRNSPRSWLCYILQSARCSSASSLDQYCMLTISFPASLRLWISMRMLSLNIQKLIYSSGKVNWGAVRDSQKHSVISWINILIMRHISALQYWSYMSLCCRDTYMVSISTAAWLNYSICVIWSLGSSLHFKHFVNQQPHRNVTQCRCRWGCIILKAIARLLYNNSLF